jgi:hypothetical protein
MDTHPPYILTSEDDEAVKDYFYGDAPEVEIVTDYDKMVGWYAHTYVDRAIDNIVPDFRYENSKDEYRVRGNNYHYLHILQTIILITHTGDRYSTGESPVGSVYINRKLQMAMNLIENQSISGVIVYSPLGENNVMPWKLTWVVNDTNVWAYDPNHISIPLE